MNDGGTFGKRFEKKFVVDETFIRKFALNEHDLFAETFSFDYKNSDSIFTIVENIHFDSFDLDSYHDAMEKKKERHKLRVRYYAPNGLPESNLFLEIKSKINKETVKRRIELKKNWLKPLISTGQYNMDKIRKENKKKDPEEIREILEHVQYFTQDLKYRPMMKSSYMRFAFKLKKTDKVRITMDRDIRYTRLSFSVEPRIPYEKSIERDDIIVELKIGDPAYTELLDKFKEKFGKPQGFSKYAYGIYLTKHRFMAVNQEISQKAIASYQKKLL